MPYINGSTFYSFSFLLLVFGLGSGRVNYHVPHERLRIKSIIHKFASNVGIIVE